MSSSPAVITRYPHCGRASSIKFITVTSGIHSISDFFLTVGFLIQWPTLLTLILWPFLIFAYYRLAKREEGEVSKQFPEKFAAYRAAVPAFFPRISNGKTMQPL
jgi:protein-S-isoprenylcysteine O-methyltransferase Ste14